MATSSSTSSSDLRLDLAAAIVVIGLLVLGDMAAALPTYMTRTARQPLEHLVYDISPEHIAGVSDGGRLVSNAQSLRGEIFSPRTTNVLLVGGSTAYCQLLDEPDMLAARIGHHLRARLERADIRSATSARGGQMVWRSTENVGWLSERRSTRPDLVIGLVGLNNMIDFFIHAPWPEGMDAGSADAWIPETSPFTPARQRDTLGRYNDPSSDGSWVHALRRAYADHAKAGTLDPSLDEVLGRALQRYQDELSRLLETTRAAESQLVLVTQPINWDVDRPERATNWNLYVNPGPGEGFVPDPSLMAELLERFNAETRAFAADQGLTLVDLAPLSDCATCFYDQWHFTVSGADAAGALVAAGTARTLSD